MRCDVTETLSVACELCLCVSVCDVRCPWRCLGAAAGRIGEENVVYGVYV